MKATVTFPVYRKYEHNRTFFKVISEEVFEELQLIGNHYSIHTLKAKILPDRNFMYDLTYDFNKNWIEITEEEYTAMMKECEKSKKRLA